MNGIRDDAVIGDVLIGEQPRRAGKHAPLAVRCHTARHDQPDLPPRALGVKGRDTRPILGLF